MSASAVLSQTSESNKTPTTDRAELVSRCEAATVEVKLLREVKQDAKNALKKADDALDAERKAGKLTQEQLTDRTSEVAALRVAYSKAVDAYELKDKETQELRKQIDSLRKRKNFFKMIAKYETIFLLALAGVVVLQN